MKYLTAILALALLTAAAPKPALVIHLSDFSFKPASATVNAGETVEFVNDDPYPHTVTASNGAFDSGNLDEHASWSYTFKKTGTYTLTCTYHPNMKGTLTVR
jgi:plastocyanin